jgi:hypothetical protein
MKLVSIGGVTLASHNLAGGIVRGPPGPDRNPNTLERTGAPALIAGVRRGARPTPLAIHLSPSFTTSQQDRVAEYWVRKFLGKIDVESDAPRLIVCQIATGTDRALDTTVECLGVAGGWQ